MAVSADSSGKLFLPQCICENIQNEKEKAMNKEQEKEMEKMLLENMLKEFYIQDGDFKKARDIYCRFDKSVNWFLNFENDVKEFYRPLVENYPKRIILELITTFLRNGFKPDSILDFLRIAINIIDQNPEIKHNIDYKTLTKTAKETYFDRMADERESEEVKSVIIDSIFLKSVNKAAMLKVLEEINVGGVHISPIFNTELTNKLCIDYMIFNQIIKSLKAHDLIHDRGVSKPLAWHLVCSIAKIQDYIYS